MKKIMIKLFILLIVGGLITSLCLGYGQFMVAAFCFLLFLTIGVMVIPYAFEDVEVATLAFMCWLMIFVGVGMAYETVGQRQRWHLYQTGEVITWQQAMFNRHSAYNLPDGVESGSSPEDYADVYPHPSQVKVSHN